MVGRSGASWLVLSVMTEPPNLMKVSMKLPGVRSQESEAQCDQSYSEC
jgi:hypothetical protein